MLENQVHLCRQIIYQLHALFLRAAFFASSLMRKTMAARSKATVIYATETGKSETLANNLRDLFNCAFNTRVRKSTSLP